MPLHPMLVHFPVVLAVLAVPAVLYALWLTKREDVRSTIWVGIFILSLGLTASSFAAMLSGEQDEERVERVVSERMIEAHEEKGELMGWVSLAPLGLALLNIYRRNGVTKGLLAVASVGMLGLTVAVGHSGAALVYEQGAASAFVTPAGGGERGGAPMGDAGKDDND